MARFKTRDSCPLIPGHLYRFPDGTRKQFRDHVHARYDGYHVVEFFDPDTHRRCTLEADSLDALTCYPLLAPELPHDASWLLRRRLRRLLSPRAADRAAAVHDIAAMGERALPALPWLQHTAYFDDIEVEDAFGRQTNPRAQARHALDALARLPTVAQAIDRMQPIVDIGRRPPRAAEPRPRLP